MTKSLKRPLLGLLIVTLLVTMVPAGAMAQTDAEPTQREQIAVTDEERADRLEALKQRVISQIERRLDALERLRNRIGSADHLSESHAASLLRDIAVAEPVLVAGIEAVTAASTVEELREVVPTIFESTLVFALLGPKTHAVIASDTSVAASERFGEFEAKLQAALDELAEAGIETAEAQTDLDEMARLVAAAASGAGPVAGNVIGLQPSDWPDPAKAALREARATLSAARNQLREAKGLGKAVARFIRSNSTDA